MIPEVNTRQRAAPSGAFRLCLLFRIGLIPMFRKRPPDRRIDGMFESLQERLGSILNGLTGRGALSEADVSAALREVRRALLEADVALEVVRAFTDKVRAKAVGAE